MNCPECGEHRSKIIDSRRRASGSVYRRRGCVSCGFRWSTTEIHVAEAHQAKAIGQRELVKRLAKVLGREVLAAAS